MGFFSRTSSRTLRTPGRRALAFDCLEERAVPAVTASFNSGILSVVGDSAANSIRVGADAAGNLTVTEANQPVAIRVVSGSPTRDQATLVSIEGKGGNDTLVTDASLNRIVNGALAGAPDAILRGGSGNDSLTVGHGGIVGGLAGVDANGVVVGKVVGNALMEGGDGNDSLVSGFGNDIMRGGDGDDAYLWPPGTLTDLWDGGAGNDTATIIGNDTFLTNAPAADAFDLSAQGKDVLFRRTNLVQFSVLIANTETVALRPGAGDDTVHVGDLTGVAHLRQVTADGAAGNDRLDASDQRNAKIAAIFLGGIGNDVLLGGAGRDLLSGDAGNDTLSGGTGADSLLGGDGDDSLDGGDDSAKDTLIGGAGADSFRQRCGDLFVDLLAADGDVALPNVKAAAKKK